MNSENKKDSLKEKLQIPVRIYVYYFMLVLTFSYIYYHKFVQHADFYQRFSPAGILSVLNFESVTPIQYRLLTSFLYKAFSVVFLFLNPKPVYFILLLFLGMLTILAFYLILNKYFTDKTLNAWSAPVILYPALWNLIILNGQFFHYDFTLLSIQVIGLYMVINDNKFWLILLTLLGTINHDAISIIIVAFLVYNFFKMNRRKYILFFIIYAVIYIAGIFILQYVFRNNVSDYASQMPATEHFFFFKVFMNIDTLRQLSTHIILRDLIFNFGALLLLVVLMIGKTKYINIKHSLFYIFWLIPICFVMVIFRAGIEEMRNYSAIIPFVTLLFLVYFSRLKNSALNLTSELTKNSP